MSRLTGELAPVGERCGGCGLAVGGWATGVTGDGRRTFDRPAYVEEEGGNRKWRGGLTHVERGEKCAPVAAVVVAETEPHQADRVVSLGAARAKLAAVGASS